MFGTITFAVVFALVFGFVMLGFTFLMLSDFMLKRVCKKSIEITKMMMKEMEENDWL